jgi:hypothetical protein
VTNGSRSIAAMRSDALSSNFADRGVTITCPVARATPCRSSSSV